MHPIERLRYVARASDVPGDVLARETAMALAAFVGDDAAMLIACRRILDRQPSAGALVWLAAHALGSPDPNKALWDAVDLLEEDQSLAALAYNLPDDAIVTTVGWAPWADELARKRGDIGFVAIDTDGSVEYRADRAADAGHQVTVVDTEGAAQAMHDATHALITLDALGPNTGLSALGSFGVAAVAAHVNVQVWGIASVGVALADKMYDGLLRRWHERAGDPRYLRAREEVPTALFDAVITTGGSVSAEQAVHQGGCPIVPELF